MAEMTDAAKTKLVKSSKDLFTQLEYQMEIAEKLLDVVDNLQKRKQYSVANELLAVTDKLLTYGTEMERIGGELAQEAKTNG